MCHTSSLPRWPSGKESACPCRRCKRCEFHPWVGKIPWRRKWQPTPVFLPGKSHGAWWAIVHGVTKNQERLSDWVHTHYIQYDWKLGCKNRYPDWEKATWRWRQRLEWCIYKPRIAGRSQKLGKGKEGHCPRAFRESGALPARWSGASGPQDSERNVLF